MTPESQVGTDPRLERSQSATLELDDLALRPGLESQVAEHVSPDERQRLAQRCDGLRRLQPSGLPDELVEAVDVRLAGPDDQLVGVVAGEQAPRPEQLPELRDV